MLLWPMRMNTFVLVILCITTLCVSSFGEDRVAKSRPEIGQLQLTFTERHKLSAMDIADCSAYTRPSSTTSAPL